MKDYYVLAKPGLVYGNLIPVIAGFLMGSAKFGDGISFFALLATIVGIALVMASGCVFNNVIDRRIDGVMARTKDRAIVAGRISPRAAIMYGICLGVAGFAALSLGTIFFHAGAIAIAVAAAGWLAYVVLYSLWAKRRTVHGALVGSIAGAVPPVVGYAAATGRIDLGAVLLFFILVAWQMPHFYSIAIYRLDDYRAAGIPVLPARKGIVATKRIIFAYVLAFAILAPLLAVFGYAGSAYFAIAIVLGIVWLALGVRGLWSEWDITKEKAWARTMFFLSLVVMSVLFLTLAINSLV